MKKGRTFWRWLVVWTRALLIEEERQKRCERELIASIDRHTSESLREYLKECNKEERSEIRRMWRKIDGIDETEVSSSCDTKSIGTLSGNHIGFGSF